MFNITSKLVTKFKFKLVIRYKIFFSLKAWVFKHNDS